MVHPSLLTYCGIIALNDLPEEALTPQIVVEHSLRTAHILRSKGYLIMLTCLPWLGRISQYIHEFKITY